MEPPTTDNQGAQESALGRAAKRKRFRFRNEVALTLVALSVSGAMVIIPRPTYPEVLPLPNVDRQQISAREQEEIRRALAVADGSLDKEARAVGELVRRLGLALAARNMVAGPELDSLRSDAHKLLLREATDDTPSGAEALLNLRALQGQLFLDAIESWQATGEVNDDLKELGGPFHTIARESWLRDGEFVLQMDELRLFFRVHWGKLTGLHGVDPFGPSLEELRRYYLSNLEHPPGAPGDLMTQTINQIGFVRALGKVESSYPALLAEGILQLRLGQALLALENLQAHLKQHPDGPWTHIARNHQILAARRIDEIANAVR